MQLTKAALIAQARLPRLNIHGSLEKWRKVELAWTITRAEFALADRPTRPDLCPATTAHTRRSGPLTGVNPRRLAGGAAAGS